MGLFRYRRSGRWSERWGGVDIRLAGRRTRFLVGTKAEARAVLEERLTEARRGKFPIFRPPTAPAVFGTVAERFLAEHAAQKRDPRSFQSIVRTLKPHFSGRSLEQIDAVASRDFMRARLAERASNGTVNRGRAIPSGIISWTIEAGIWNGAPTRA